MTRLVREIRIVEKALGNCDKRLLSIEKKFMYKMAKSLVLTMDIKKGEIIKRHHLTTKSPGTGVSPVKMNLIIGKKCNRDIAADTVLMDEFFTF